MRLQELLPASATIVEAIELEPRKPRHLPIPEPYCAGATGAWLGQMIGGDQLWRHQALALSHIAAGDNLVIATPTASGKSLAFTAPIVHELLTGSGKALILYPQKALGGDQFSRLERAVVLAGLDAALIGEINGDVAPAVRDDVLSRCRVILATPDVIHCWLMRQAQSVAVQKFLQDLRFLVLDEAHVFDGIFGSNSAYLFRRLRSIHAQARDPKAGDSRQLQLIAATATIADPAAHLELLTGRPFVAITAVDNGAPFYGLTLMHIDGPSHGAPAEKMLADVYSHVAEQIAPNGLIAFADSRQGVERVTRYVNRDDVLPYRGGYDGHDRTRIENSLRDNRLLGVVSTSALELGIDIPQFIFGFNLGVPQTRKALRQRIGRIGRTMRGAFAVIAPASEFAQLGGTFRDFLDGEAEPSQLYLHNRYIQFQAARCLLEECEVEAGTPALPDNVDWPSGFADMFAAAQPGAIRPPDLDQLASLGGDSPHYAYPLRAICESKFALRDVRNPQDVIGTIELDKALREAPPGATYHHLRRAYRVIEWRTNSYERSILLKRVDHAENTQALLCTRVSVSTEPGELLDSRILEGERGALAEITLRVTDSVEGYRIGSTVFPYRDLIKTNRKMSRKHREFATTGVLLRIQAEWFSGESDHATKLRDTVAKALAAVLAREHSIAPSDIRTAHTRIAICGPSGPRPTEDAIVIFDNVVGGLRLTAPLFTEFESVLDRLDRAAELAREDALLGASTIGRLRDWHGSLAPSQSIVQALPPSAGDGVLIFAPQSEVGVRVRGALIERRLLEPQFVTMGDDDVLMYRYEVDQGVTGWVAHDHVEPIGHNWQHAIWDPTSNEIREVAA